MSDCDENTDLIELEVPFNVTKTSSSSMTTTSDSNNIDNQTIQSKRAVGSSSDTTDCDKIVTTTDHSRSLPSSPSQIQSSSLSVNSLNS